VVIGGAPRIGGKISPRTRYDSNVTLVRTRDAAKIALTRSPRLYTALRRPYAVGRFGLRQPHDPDYGVFGQFRDRQGPFLDVGANAGMSALSFRIYHPAPIMSIEPNPFHEPDLRFAGRLTRRHSYRMWAAGSETGQMMLHIPVYRGVPLTSEASLLREEITDSNYLRRRLGAGMDSPEFEIVAREVPIRPLDCLDMAPDFIKLDVQGFELQALVGLRQTLARSHPVLLVETPGSAVQTFLADYAYDAFVYRDRRLEPAIDLDRGNIVFV
jgi:FkbM family methyltransferase